MTEQQNKSRDEEEIRSLVNHIQGLLKDRQYIVAIGNDEGFGIACHGLSQANTTKLVTTLSEHAMIERGDKTKYKITGEDRYLADGVYVEETEDAIILKTDRVVKGELDVHYTVLGTNAMKALIKQIALRLIMEMPPWERSSIMDEVIKMRSAF